MLKLIGNLPPKTCLNPERKLAEMQAIDLLVARSSVTGNNAFLRVSDRSGDQEHRSEAVSFHVAASAGASWF